MFGSCVIPSLLDQNVKYDSLLIDDSSEPMALARIFNATSSNATCR
jgi:hypothetical protein